MCVPGLRLMETTSYPLESMTPSGGCETYVIWLQFLVKSSLSLFADIAAGDISNIISRLSAKPYITQEVIYGAGEPITPAMYVGNGAYCFKL